MTHHDCQSTHDHHGCDDHGHNSREGCCCHDHDHQIEHHHGPNGECCGQHSHEDSENVESYFRAKNTSVAFIELKEQMRSVCRQIGKKSFHPQGFADRTATERLFLVDRIVNRTTECLLSRRHSVVVFGYTG